MKLKIICIADSTKQFSSCIDDYVKRFRKNELSIYYIKPSKWKNTKSIITSDTEKLKKVLNKENSFKILLSNKWRNVTTEDIVNIVKKNIKVTFVIWGPYWVDEDELEKYIDDKISFGWITMSHLIVLVVLLEQLFRVKTIIEWRKYHY